MCNVNVENRISCYCLYFFLEGIGGGFGHPGHLIGYAPGDERSVNITSKAQQNVERIEAACAQTTLLSRLLTGRRTSSSG